MPVLSEEPAIVPVEQKPSTSGDHQNESENLAASSSGDHPALEEKSEENDDRQASGDGLAKKEASAKATEIARVGSVLTFIDKPDDKRELVSLEVCFNLQYSKAVFLVPSA